MDFYNASILGVDQESVFLGERTARLKTIRKLSIEGFIDTRFSNVDGSGVKEVTDEIKHQISILSGLQTQDRNLIENIHINGMFYGKGKITSFTFNSSENHLDNQVFMGSYSASVEIYIEGDISNIYANINPQLIRLDLLEDFSEDFSFSLSENNEYECEHSFSFSYIQSEKNIDFIVLAENFANLLFSRSPKNFNGQLAFSNGNLFSNAKRFQTKTHDLESNSFSFSRKFSFHETINPLYSFSSDISFDFDENGIVKMTESGKIKSINSNLSEALQAATEEIELNNKAYTRCANAYAVYKNNIYNQNLGQLIALPIEISKTIDNNSAEIQYSVTFTDDSSYSAFGYFQEVTTEKDVSEDSVIDITVSIKKEYTALGNKDLANANPLISFKQIAISAALNFYNRTVQFPLKLTLTSSNTSLEKLDSRLDSTFNFTDDPKYFVEKIENWKQIFGENREILAEESFTIEDDIGVENLREYTIPNGAIISKSLVHRPGQTSLGKKTIKGSFKLKRLETNILTDIRGYKITLSKFINIAIQKMRILLINDYLRRNIQQITVLDFNEFFISNVSYDFDSNYTVNITIEAQYPMVR